MRFYLLLDSKIKQQQHAFNRAYGHGTEHIKFPNELNPWDEHAWRLRNDAKYREQYKEHPMIGGDDAPCFLYIYFFYAIKNCCT